MPKKRLFQVKRSALGVKYDHAILLFQAQQGQRVNRLHDVRNGRKWSWIRLISRAEWHNTSCCMLNVVVVASYYLLNSRWDGCPTVRMIYDLRLG